MRRFLALCWLCISMSGARAGVDDYPAIRAITAFVVIDAAGYEKQLHGAAMFLREARAQLNAAGFSGAAGRITTQPFPRYTEHLSRDEALALIRNLRRIAAEEHVDLNIGPAMMNDSDDVEPVSLLATALAEQGVQANIIVADDRGLHWRAIQRAARLVQELSRTGSHGDGNFNFAALAMVKPYGPYYPGSWHDGSGLHFSIGLETANVVNRTFQHYHEPREAEATLAAELSRYTTEAEAVAVKIAARTGWTYEGIDATPAPGRRFSIGAAIEAFLGAPIGSYGSLTAAGIITRAVQSTPVKRTGYSGLMLPVLEDAVLAQRWSEGRFGLDSILAWSAVCAAGVDTVPLAAETSENDIARLIGDVSWLAYKWHKPLSARLMLARETHAGEITGFTVQGIVNTRVH